MSPPHADVIDHLADISAGSRLDVVRRARPEARTHAQRSFEALFVPADAGGLSIVDRHVLAAFVAGLHQEPITSSFYASRLASVAGNGKLAGIVAAEIKRGLAPGPYGQFPAGPLTAENLAGPLYRVDADNKAQLGDALSAALEHAHLLVLHPRDASAEKLQTLLNAGLTANVIVTVSQLVAFLSFQIRVIAGLRVLAA